MKLAMKDSRVLVIFASSEDRRDPDRVRGSGFFTRRQYRGAPLPKPTVPRSCRRQVPRIAASPEPRPDHRTVRIGLSEFRTFR